MMSIRLPDYMESELERQAKQSGKTKSDLVKESLAQYLNSNQTIVTPYQLGEDLFGKYSSGNADLASSRKKLADSFLKGKHEKRSTH
jgi:RHH-type transcriptional regulator, rel operon repressor / antitoxin RelB